MKRNGTIMNEFGEKVGSYWFRIGQNAWSFIWLGIRFNGFTYEGIVEWVNEHEYYMVED